MFAQRFVVRSVVNMENIWVVHLFSLNLIQFN